DTWQQFGELVLAGLQFITQPGHLGHHGGSVLALALEHADLLGQCIAPGLQLLRARLQRLAFRLQRLELGRVEGETAAAHGGYDAVHVVAEELDVDHLESGESGCSGAFLRAAASSWRRWASLAAICASRPRSTGRYQPGGAMPSGRYCSL